MLAAGLALFAIGMLVTGSSIDDARTGLWMIGPYRSGWLFQPWTFRALTGADWWAVLGQAAGILTVVLVAVIGVLFNVSGNELVLRRDLDTNRELRDAGLLNVVSGAFGGVPGYHALSLTALAERMNVDARAAGLIASLVPLAALLFGAAVIELIPRMIVGGVLVFLGLTFIVEWVWDKRRTLPKVEYVVVLVILAGIIAKGFLPGVVIGLVMAVVLFAVSYGRIELVHEVAFGDIVRSNVDRPPAERAALRTMGERVQILRVRGFVFFGSASGLLGADPGAGGDGTPAMPADGPPAGDGRGRLGGDVVRQGDPPRGGERVRARARGCLGSGAQAARTWRRGHRRRGRPVRAGPGSRPAAVRGPRAGGGSGRAALGRRSGRRARRACRRACGPPSSACPSRRGPC